MNSNPANILHEIYLREIHRLNEKSKDEPLDGREIKCLEMLSKAYSNFRTQPIQQEDDDDLNDLSADDILSRLHDSNTTR